MKDLFKKIIKESVHKEYAGINERELKVPFDIRKIITITGARRSGKTYYLYSIIKKLRETINSELLIYINFDDDRLFPLELKSLNGFIESYYELYPGKKDETVYFFFDEIQNIPNWELFVRRIYDKENCKIFLTGSSSRLLSKEIATSLRGRTLVYELFPLSFAEYLKWKNVKIVPHSLKSQSHIINAFQKYLFSSSFPELYNYDNDSVKNALHEYLNMIIYKDLIERYRINNHFLVKYLVKFLLNNAALISVNKAYNDFKSMGLSVSKQSIFQYIDYLEDAYIFYSVPVFTDNLREKNRNPQKIFTIDTGLKNLVSVSYDIGRIYENIVFLELRRKYKEIFYSKLKQEVDFCFYESNDLKLINVCYSLSDIETRTREINGICEAMKFYKVKESIVINNEIEEDVFIEKKKIKILPLWKWLLL